MFTHIAVDFNLSIYLVKVHECMHGVTYTKISVRAYTMAAPTNR